MTDTYTREQTSRADEAKQAAGNVAGEAGDKAGQVASQAKDKAAQVASTAADKANDVLSSTRQELRDKASQEATNFGDRLSSFAEELRSMSRASDESGGMTGGVVSSLADQVDRSAQRLSNGELDQVVDDVKRFARNNPGVFLLGAAGAGFAIGRLLRSADLKQVGQAVKPQQSSDQQRLGQGAAADPWAPNPGSTPMPAAGATSVPPTTSPAPDATVTPPPTSETF